MSAARRDDVPAALAEVDATSDATSIEAMVRCIRVEDEREQPDSARSPRLAGPHATLVFTEDAT